MLGLGDGGRGGTGLLGNWHGGELEDVFALCVVAFGHVEGTQIDDARRFGTLMRKEEKNTIIKTFVNSNLFIFTIKNLFIAIYICLYAHFYKSISLNQNKINHIICIFPLTDLLTHNPSPVVDG